MASWWESAGMDWSDLCAQEGAEGRVGRCRSSKEEQELLLQIVLREPPEDEVEEPHFNPFAHKSFDQMVFECDRWLDEDEVVNYPEDEMS